MQKILLHKSLNTPLDEFSIISGSDTMWFCTDCRVAAEKQIITDLKIEERCKAKKTTLENSVANKCDETKVIQFIKRHLR